MHAFEAHTPTDISAALLGTRRLYLSLFISSSKGKQLHSTKTHSALSEGGRREQFLCILYLIIERISGRKRNEKNGETLINVGRRAGNYVARDGGGGSVFVRAVGRPQ